MDIKTKFNIGETVYFMKDNIIVLAIISAIRTFNTTNNKGNISYSASNIHDSVSWLDHETLHEENLFKSKQALSNFLVGIRCKGVELPDGNFTSCDGSMGDCPECGE